MTLKSYQAQEHKFYDDIRTINQLGQCTYFLRINSRLLMSRIFNMRLYSYSRHLKSPFAERTQEMQFAAFLVARTDTAIEQNESRREVGSLNEIQTGSCRAYRLRLHPQRLARRLERRVGVPFLSHASTKISINPFKRHRFKTNCKRVFMDLFVRVKIYRIVIRQVHREVESVIQY